jgi:hypothetical protein
MIQHMPGRRKIVDIQKFKSIALQHVSEDVFTSALDASFGPIEEAISEAAPRGSKKATVEAFQAELEQSQAVQRGDSYSFLKVSSAKK